MKLLKLMLSITIAFVIVLIAIVFIEGLRVNITPSIPLGIYKVLNVEPKKGDYAWFCPPDIWQIKEAKRRGYIPIGDCPGSYAHFMKQVAAVVGDKVTINESGVFVNGKLLNYSKPISNDSVGNSLFLYKLNDYRIKNGEYLMMTDRLQNSFDSRYFGLVSGKIFKLNRVLEWN